MLNATAIAALYLAAGFGAAPESYLSRMQNALEACRADLTAMAAAADTAAASLAAGGKLWAAGQPSMIGELTGRAGGIMMIRGLRDATPEAGDVILHFPETDTEAPPGPGYVVQFGRHTGEEGVAYFSNYAEKCALSPTLANAIPGWIFTGELIAALTRLGKMPVIYESIGAYGGNARMLQFKYGEIAWHEDMKVPPVPAEQLGAAYIDAIQRMLRRVAVEEAEDLARAGAWGREARAQGKARHMYSMGHLFPDEIEKTEIGKSFLSAVWNAGFRQPVPEDAYSPREACVHIGYQHPPKEMLARARQAGATAVYVSVLSDRDSAKDPGVAWIDPMWDWPDACVPLEGYDVPLLAASGLVNGAIAWEIWRLGM